MEVNTHQRIPVTERSQVSAARVDARRLARSVGFEEPDEYRVSLVVSELSTNLVKHTREGGEILLRAFDEGAGPGVEVIALDRGEGIADIGRALTDGVSTGDSPGTGLGAVRRLADVFDIYAARGGTAVLARLARDRTPPPARPIVVGGVSVPAAGESICGDLWAARPTCDGLAIVLADGLGHGPGAHEAARAVLEAVHVEAEPQAALERVHAAVRHTRGAAAAVARLQPREDAITFAGVGNISGLVAEGAAQQHMVSVNGTVGHQAQGIRQFQYRWPAHAVVVLFSDGLGTHWTFDRHPGLVLRHPALVAAVLYRDHSRRRDDVTVVVARRRDV